MLLEIVFKFEAAQDVVRLENDASKIDTMGTVEQDSRISFLSRILYCLRRLTRKQEQ